MFDPQQLVSSVQLGEVLGLTGRRVQQLENEGVFNNVGEGRSKRFRLAESVCAYVAKCEMATVEPESGSSREQYEIERARKLKLANDQSEALLIQTPVALAAVDQIFGEVRTALSGIPARATDDVVIRRRIEDAIDSALHDIVARLDAACAALEAGTDPAASDAEDVA